MWRGAGVKRTSLHLRAFQICHSWCSPELMPSNARLAVELIFLIAGRLVCFYGNESKQGSLFIFVSFPREIGKHSPGFQACLGNLDFMQIIKKKKGREGEKTAPENRRGCRKYNGAARWLLTPSDGCQQLWLAFPPPFFCITFLRG